MNSNRGSGFGVKVLETLPEGYEVWLVRTQPAQLPAPDAIHNLLEKMHSAPHGARRGTPPGTAWWTAARRRRFPGRYKQYLRNRTAL